MVKDAARPLSGRVCMVTGATAGIGRATAEALARLGANVVAVGRKAEAGERLADRLRKETGNPLIEFLRADLSLQSDVRGLGHDTAAGSLKEGLEETLTVVVLGLSGSLRSFFATTNAIENVMGSVRDVTANVKRWRRGDMIKRWLGLSFLTAAKRFRRVKGFRQMPALVQALRSNEAAVIDAKTAIA